MDRQSNKSSTSLSGINKKKWSLGRFFRRKNKGIESDLSSDDDRKAGFSLSHQYQQHPHLDQQQRINKKDKIKRSSKLIGAGFDHIVLNPKENDFFISFEQIELPNQFRRTSSLDNRAAPCERKKGSAANITLPTNRQSTQHQCNSSTDEELIFMRSSLPYRSDDSLGSSGVANVSSSSSRKSRAARNERYLKRLNRDGELGSTPMMQITQQVGRWKTQPIITQQSAPLSIFNERNQNNSSILIKTAAHNNIQTPQIEYYSKNSSYPGKLSYPTNKQQYYRSYYSTKNRKNLQNTVEPEKRSVSFDSQINLQKFQTVPVSNAPPPPPRRDSQRRISVGSIQKELRPISYAFDPNMKPVYIMNGRCLSDDRLWGTNNGIYKNNSIQQRPNSTQPPSVSVVPQIQRRFITRAERDANKDQCNSSQIYHDYQYVAESIPRSRKPIHSFNLGQTQSQTKHQTANTNSIQIQSPIRTTKNGLSGPSPLRVASDFWKQIDEQENNRRGREITGNNPMCSKPRALSSSCVNDARNYNNGELLKNRTAGNNLYTDKLTNIISGSLIIKPSTSKDCIGITKKSDIGNNNKSKTMPNYYNGNCQISPSNKYDIHVLKQHTAGRDDCIKIPPKTPKRKTSIVNPEDFLLKKPTNLEDAINELEAIYKSLKLGDDDLMDRAERCDIASTTSFDKYAKKKEYFDDEDSDQTPEPDVVLDDVAYRNAKHANTIVNAVKSQPPFGIPIGPIPPSPNTDYLHVNPDKDKKKKIRYSSHNYPDLITDDLAVRRLRKDSPGQSIPHFVYSSDSLKKKRATRTQSANIYTLIQRNAAKPCGGDLLNYFEIEKALEKAGSLTDINKTVGDIPVTLQLLKNIHNEDQNIMSRKQIFRHPSHGGAIFSLPTNLKTHDDNNYNKQPIPLPRRNSCSPDTSKSLSGVEEFLNNIAKEAKESSKKLERDLIELRKEAAIHSTQKANDEQKLIEIEKVSQAAKRWEEILLESVPPEEILDVVKPRKLKKETKLLKVIDQTSDAANTVCQKILNEIVATEPPIIVQKAIKVKNNNLHDSNMEMKKDLYENFVVASLMKKLDPSSQEIGKIASRCMRQISELGNIKDKIVEDDIPDYDNLNGNIDQLIEPNSNIFCKNSKKTKSVYRNIIDNENSLIVLEDDVPKKRTNSPHQEDDIDKIMIECEKRVPTVSSYKNSNLLCQSSEESARGSDDAATATVRHHSTEGGLFRIDGIIINTPFSSSSDCINSSSRTPNRHQTSSITSINNAFSSSDYIKSPSSEINPPSTDQIKTFSTTSYEVQTSCSSAAATPNLINLSSAFSECTTPSPSINLTPIGNENEVFNSSENIYSKFDNLKKDIYDNNNNSSQYNSSEELAMIFGITRSSSPTTGSHATTTDSVAPNLLFLDLEEKLSSSLNAANLSCHQQSPQLIQFNKSHSTELLNLSYDPINYQSVYKVKLIETNTIEKLFPIGTSKSTSHLDQLVSKKLPSLQSLKLYPKKEFKKKNRFSSSIPVHGESCCGDYHLPLHVQSCSGETFIYADINRHQHNLAFHGVSSESRPHSGLSDIICKEKEFEIKNMSSIDAAASSFADGATCCSKNKINSSKTNEDQKILNIFTNSSTSTTKSNDKINIIPSGETVLTEIQPQTEGFVKLNHKDNLLKFSTLSTQHKNISFSSSSKDNTLLSTNDLINLNNYNKKNMHDRDSNTSGPTNGNNLYHSMLNNGIDCGTVNKCEKENNEEKQMDMNIKVSKHICDNNKINRRSRTSSQTEKRYITRTSRNPDNISDSSSTSSNHHVKYHSGATSIPVMSSISSQTPGSTNCLNSPILSPSHTTTAHSLSSPSNFNNYNKINHQQFSCVSPGYGASINGSNTKKSNDNQLRLINVNNNNANNNNNINFRNLLTTTDIISGSAGLSDNRNSPQIVRTTKASRLRDAALDKKKDDNEGLSSSNILALPHQPRYFPKCNLAQNLNNGQKLIGNNSDANKSSDDLSSVNSIVGYKSQLCRNKYGVASTVAITDDNSSITTEAPHIENKELVPSISVLFKQNFKELFINVRRNTLFNCNGSTSVTEESSLQKIDNYKNTLHNDEITEYTMKIGVNSLPKQKEITNESEELLVDIQENKENNLRPRSSTMNSVVNSAADFELSPVRSSKISTSPRNEDRDKSSKRKSNLNRAYNEESTQDDTVINRSRRRRELGMSRQLIPNDESTAIHDVLGSIRAIEMKSTDITSNLNSLQSRPIIKDFINTDISVDQKQSGEGNLNREITTLKNNSPPINHIAVEKAGLEPKLKNTQKIYVKPETEELVRSFNREYEYMKKNKRLSDVTKKFDKIRQRTKSELAEIQKITAKCRSLTPALEQFKFNLQENGNDVISVSVNEEKSPITTTVREKKRYFTFDFGSPNLNFNSFLIKSEPVTSKLFEIESKNVQQSNSNGQYKILEPISMRAYSKMDRKSCDEQVYLSDEPYNSNNYQQNCRMLKGYSQDPEMTPSTDLICTTKLSPIFRRKSSDEQSSSSSATNHIVSILKKKDHAESSSASSNASPVTFSSSVVDTPTRTSAKRQGILKKRSSLDESRYYGRSHSPDERSILVKSTRRNSLEETNQHGILKQSSYESKSDGCPSAEPHGILKKKDSNSTPAELIAPISKHVSISQAVILAAAELYNDQVLENTYNNLNNNSNIVEGVSYSSNSVSIDYCSGSEYDIKPILKTDNQEYRTPKPILKKKSSCETEEIRPILKTSRKSSHEEPSDIDENLWRSILKNSNSPAKQRSLVSEELEPNILPIRSKSLDNPENDEIIHLSPQSSLSASSSGILPTISVAARIRNMEIFLSSSNKNSSATDGSEVTLSLNKTHTGAVPKIYKHNVIRRNTNKNHFKTQPITNDELNDLKSFSDSFAPFDQDKLDYSLNILQSPISSRTELSNTASFEQHSTNTTAGAIDQYSPTLFSGVDQASLLRKNSVKSKTNMFQHLEEKIKVNNSEEKQSVARKVSPRVSPQPVQSLIDLNSNPEEEHIESIKSPATTIQKSITMETKKSILKSKSGCIGFLPSDLNSEFKIRLKKSTKATLSNLRKSSTTDDNISINSGSDITTNCLKTQSSSSEDDEDGVDPQKNLAKILRSVSKENMHKQHHHYSHHTLPTYQPVHHDDTTSLIRNLTTLEKGPSVGAVISTGSTNSTSEGESSGGREILTIIKNSAVARRRKLNDGNLISKSKSHSSIQSTLDLPAASIGDLNYGNQPATAGFVRLLKNINLNSSEENANNSGKNSEHLQRKENLSTLPGYLRGGIQKSYTQVMRPDQYGVAKTSSIAERLAALQKSGEDDWRKRISKREEEDIRGVSFVNDSFSITNSLADKPKPLPASNIISNKECGKVSERLGKLKSSSESWKNRIEQSDASKFTIAGRLQTKSTVKLQFERIEPKCSIMRMLRSTNPSVKGLLKNSSMMDTSLTLVDANQVGQNNILKRSSSINGADVNCMGECTIRKINQNHKSTKVSVLKIDDYETFSKFFISTTNMTPEIHEIENHNNSDIPFDFDIIKSTERLITKRTVQGPRGRRVAKNPLKTLAARNDLQSEYIETKTGIADTELKRIKLESFNKSCNLAAEAIAGLASFEDYKAVNLKSSSLPLNQMYLPYKSLMLLHIKGRTHVQTRLVEPSYISLNRGDCFILVAGNKLFRYVGSFANVIETSRSRKICNDILENRDLGCLANSEYILNDGEGSGNWKDFWRLLNKPESYEIPESGHSDEDDLFETSLIETNRIYKFIDDSLVPLKKYWGIVPKIDVLDPKEVLVFDFGSEMYIWNGKNAISDAKRTTLRLAQEQFNLGIVDYESCYLNPLNFSKIAGDRDSYLFSKSSERYDWCVLGKITQHLETCLFREKFLDWPECTPGELEKDYLINSIDSIKPLDGISLFKGEKYSEPNLVLENSNLGRGNFYYDYDTMRHFDILTKSVSKWKINEFNFDDETEISSFGHFYSFESYIIRWVYQISVTVRELSGKVSNRNTVGRDRCVYFCWQGQDASANEKGAAALLTIELDKEKGSQMRIAQGDENTAFVRLFKVMFQHNGRREYCVTTKRFAWRLYTLNGNDESEIILKEVDCDYRQLRSRGSLLLLNGKHGLIYIWHGSKSLPVTRNICIVAANSISDSRSSELFIYDLQTIKIKEYEEKDESEEFIKALGGIRKDAFVSLYSSDKTFNFTPRMFEFSSIHGVFNASEYVFGLRTKDCVSPFPLTQAQLYNARQPTIFMIDNRDLLWMWMGWWPIEVKSENNDESSINRNRTGAHRWVAEKRAALQTAVTYWKAKFDSTCTEDEYGGIKGYVIWAGFEPLEFQSIFPEWKCRDDIKEVNLHDNCSTEPITIVKVLEQLTQTEYPLSILKTRPLPEGVDPTRLELYLNDLEFVEALGVTKEDFDELPIWKQTNIKKEHGLF